MLTVHSKATRVHSDTIRDSIHESSFLLESERDSRGLFYTSLLLTLVLHFDPDLAVEVCVQGKGSFERIQ